MDNPMNIQEQLEAFKNFTQNQKFDDGYHLRFLRAFNYDLSLTCQKWQNFMNWREENNIDYIYDFQYPELQEVREQFPHGYHFYDKQYRPVYIELLGSVNMQAINQITSQERILNYYIKVFEYQINTIFPAMRELSKQYIDKNLVIIDLKGFKYNQFNQLKSFLKSLSHITQNYYPEMLGQMFIINTPMIFTGIWKFIKKFLPQRTQEKIQIMGSNYYSALKEHINEDKIPDFFQGHSSCDLSRNIGPWNPEGKEIFPVNLNQKRKNSGVSQVLSFKTVNSLSRYAPSQPRSSLNEYQSINNSFSEINIESDPLHEELLKIKRSNIYQNFSFQTDQSILNTDLVDQVIFSNKVYALDLFKDYHLDRQKSKQKRQKLETFFKQDLIHLESKQINKIAGQRGIQFITHEIPRSRYYQLILFYFVLNIVVMAQYTILPLNNQLIKKYEQPLSLITLATLGNLFFSAVFSLFIRKCDRTNIIIGIILSLIGVWLRTIISIEYLIIGQSLIGAGKPFLMKVHNQIVIQYFPPQKRQLLAKLFTLLTVFSIFISFIVPVYVSGDIFLYQAIAMTIIFIIFLATIRLRPYEYISYLAAQNDKQNLQIQKRSHRIPRSLELLKIFFIFIIQNTVFKTNLILLSITLLVQDFSPTDISFYLCQMILSFVLSNMILSSHSQLNITATISFLFCLIIALFQHVWRYYQILAFVNFGLFIITPKILNAAVMYQQEHIQQKIIVWFLFWGNLVTILSVLGITHLIQEKTLQFNTIENYIFASFMGLGLFISFMMEKEKVDETYRPSEFDDLIVIKQEKPVLEFIAFAI